MRGTLHGVVHTLERNVQSPLRDIPLAAMHEALKVEATTHLSCEVQKLSGALVVANGKVKAAHTRAQEFHDTLDVDGELKVMHEKWQEEKKWSHNYLSILGNHK